MKGNSRSGRLADNQIASQTEFLCGRLEEILEYDRRGLVVLPLHPIIADGKTGGRSCGCQAARRGENCPGAGKHPAIRWGEESQPLGKSAIKGYFWREPTRGWACHLGPSGLACLDVDPRNGGSESLASLVEKYGPLPGTLTAQTGSGGGHWYWAMAGVALPGLTSVQLAPGVEFLSGRHITILPPSPHKSGGKYRWTSAIDPVLPPAWMLELACDLAAKQKLSRATAAGEPARLTGPVDWQAVHERVRAYLAKIPPAVSGQGGSRVTFHAACVLVRDFGLSPADAYPLLVEYSDRCQPPWSEAELRHKLDDAAKAGGTRGRLLSDEWGAGGARPLHPELLAEFPAGVLPDLEFVGDDGAALPLPPRTTPAPRGKDARRLERFRESLVRDLPDAALELTAQREAEAREAARAAAEAAEARWRQQHRLCPNCSSVVQERLDGTGFRIAQYGCRSLACSVCRPIWNERWELTFKRVAQNVVHGPTLYVWTCQDAAWPACHKAIWREGGGYWRLGETCEVVSNVRPAHASATNARVIDKAQAVTYLTLYTRNVSNWANGRHSVSHSHGWGWLKPDDSRNIYRTIGRGPDGRDGLLATYQVLDAFEITDWKVQGPKSIWDELRHGTLGDYPEIWSRRSITRFLRSLQAGRVLSEEEFEGAAEWRAEQAEVEAVAEAILTGSGAIEFDLPPLEFDLASGPSG